MIILCLQLSVNFFKKPCCFIVLGLYSFMATKDPKLKKIKRDENGLLSDVKYIFNDDGLIDWRNMIKSEYLVANKDSSRGETDTSKLKDWQLIILLGGIKELAQIRGYTNVTYDVVSPSSDYVVATCNITWRPNYETEGEEVVFSAIGDASPNNTTGFGRAFLAACAENRAFVRCVRNFLRINIVAKEELAGNSPVGSSFVGDPIQNQSDPKALLEDLMTSKNVSFATLKNKLKSEGYEVSGLESLDDLPKIKVFELIERLNSAKSKKR